MNKFNIVNSELEDLDFACHLFDEAIAYQKRKGFPEYRCDDRELQAIDIERRQHYKVVAQEEIAAVFSVWYDDKVVWRKRDQGKSIYLHRIVVNPAFKGQQILFHITAWAVAHAKSNDKTSIRLDTWAGNPSLINYYKKFNYEFIEEFQLPNTDEVGVNCRGNKVALLEFLV